MTAEGARRSSLSNSPPGVPSTQRLGLPPYAFFVTTEEEEEEEEEKEEEEEEEKEEEEEVMSPSP